MVNYFTMILFSCLLFNFNQLFSLFHSWQNLELSWPPYFPKSSFWAVLCSTRGHVCIIIPSYDMYAHKRPHQWWPNPTAQLPPVIHPRSRFSRTHCKMFLLREGTVTQLYWSHITSTSPTNDTFASSNGCSSLVVLSGALTPKSWEKLGRFLSCFVSKFSSPQQHEPV